MPYIYNDEDNAPMNERMLPAEKNCHERCCYSRPCYELYHCKGSHDASYPWECPIYSKLLDLDQDTKDIPFYDPSEPEEGELEDDT